MKIARRLSGISASPTMAVMQEAQELKARGIDIIDLGPGEPDFPTPEPVKQAGIKAIEENFTKYTPAAGILDLKEAVARRFSELSGKNFTKANVVISCGAKHAIYNVCMAVFEDGDEVLNPVPYWVTFPEVIKMTGAVPVDLLTPEENGFILNSRQVSEAMGPRTRGLIVNTPNNPTGAVIPGGTVEELARLGRERDLFLLFDETYDYFTYEGKEHVSLASFIEEQDTHFAIVGSFSKTFSMTGWRVGFCLGHKDLIKKIAEFQSHQTGNPVSISQKAALEALSTGVSQISEMKKEYARRREFVLDAIEKTPGFTCGRPEGAFYVFPNVNECMKAAGIKNSEEFSKFLIQKARVATVPGSAFGLEGYIRLSYATSMENLEKAFDRIRSAVSGGLLEKREA